MLPEIDPEVMLPERLISCDLMEPETMLRVVYGISFSPDWMCGRGKEGLQVLYKRCGGYFGDVNPHN